MKNNLPIILNDNLIVGYHNYTENKNFFEVSFGQDLIKSLTQAIKKERDGKNVLGNTNAKIREDKRK